MDICTQKLSLTPWYLYALLHVFQIEIDGLTGIVKFDEDGLRSDFEIDVIEVMAHGFEKVRCFQLNRYITISSFLNKHKYY